MIQDAIKHLSMVAGVDMTVGQMAQFLSRNIAVKAELESGRAASRHDDLLVDTLSHELIGEPWVPCGDRVTFEYWCERFHAAAASAGYAVLRDAKQDCSTNTLGAKRA